MDNLENFPCYDHSVLTDFSFQTIQPVSVTLPYDKALSGSKLIKKKVDKTKGDLVVYSFHHHTTPKEGANKQVISSQADSLIKISRIWADFFPANTSNQPI